jgi:hypothetical protein
MQHEALVAINLLGFCPILGDHYTICLRACEILALTLITEVVSEIILVFY